jgi:hypothetical protein
VVADGPAFFIPLGLGEHAAQISHARLGLAVGLLAGSSCQFFFAPRHTGGIPAHVQHGHGLAVGQRLERFWLLPGLGGGPHRLHQPLNLAGRHLNAAGFP